jgi:predicted deacylase
VTALAILVAGAVASAFFLLRAKPDEVPAPSPVASSTREVIGTSVQGREIEAHTFGTGSKRLLFVGGIHGGYEWNSVLLAYQMMDHLAANPAAIPSGVSVTIVPSANPDGVFAVVGKEGRFALADVPAYEGPSGTGRFNANNVDLNRNFDCKWQPTSMWRGAQVSAGSAAFSEPEARAIRDLVAKITPVAAVFWHSQSNAVYASACEAGILPETRAVMDAYATAAGYPAVDTFDAYVVTGAVEDWLASIGIPAITVELSTHQTIEWDKNLAGVKALLARAGGSDTF